MKPRSSIPLLPQRCINIRSSTYSAWIPMTPTRASNPARSMNMVTPHMVTTAFELPGFRISQNLGMVRGIVVRSRSIVGNFGAMLQTLFGGNITLYTQLCERARADAFQLMLEHAVEAGANAVIG